MTKKHIIYINRLTQKEISNLPKIGSKSFLSDARVYYLKAAVIAAFLLIAKRFSLPYYCKLSFNEIRQRLQNIATGNVRLNKSSIVTSC
ncbi:hypothetical protein UNH65_03495 [Chitinophaga sp. 180180018-2]|nr:hypothetical protein [Chitinophaga sp. 212800010-3]